MAENSGEAESGAEDGYKKEISGLNRRNSELEKQLADRDRQIEDLRAKDSTGDLEKRERDLRAKEIANETTARLFKRAAADEIPLSIALAFAREGTEALYDELLNTIETRTDAGVNKRIGGGTPPEASGHTERVADINSMTPSEIMRLPPGVRERAFKDVVMKAAE